MNIKKMILDKTLLVIVGIVCAILASLFWTKVPNAFEVFNFIFVIYLLAENYILRKELKKR